MIKRVKGIAPAALRDPKWDTLKQDALTRKNLHKVQDACYRDCTIDALLSLYNNKCAYCERERGTEINVDHYRPKKTRNKHSNIQYNQPGYYWLPYEWSNLLPLCSKCNQFKSNKFPLVGWNNTNRITVHENPTGQLDQRRFKLDYLNSLEDPLLLNPECEPLEFYQHFAFNENGRIVGISDKAKETIILCNLDRKDLRRERRNLVLNYVKLIKEEIDIYLNKNKVKENRDELLEHGLSVVFRMIKKNADSKSNFSLYGFYMYVYFDDIIAPHIGGKKIKALIKKAFRKFKADNGI